jgi:hypothetical protein
MIDLILDLMKSMLNSIDYPTNWNNMDMSSTRVGSLVHFKMVKVSKPYCAGTVRSWPSHSISFNSQVHLSSKWRKIFVFAVIVVRIKSDSEHACVSMYRLFLDRATKMIAKIRQCEIVVRDANRIHHFQKNGQCSCQDHFWLLLYWYCVFDGARLLGINDCDKQVFDEHQVLFLKLVRYRKEWAWLRAAEESICWMYAYCRFKMSRLQCE